MRRARGVRVRLAVDVSCASLGVAPGVAPAPALGLGPGVEEGCRHADEAGPRRLHRVACGERVPVAAADAEHQGGRPQPEPEDPVEPAPPQRQRVEDHQLPPAPDQHPPQQRDDERLQPCGAHHRHVVVPRLPRRPHRVSEVGAHPRGLAEPPVDRAVGEGDGDPGVAELLRPDLDVLLPRGREEHAKRAVVVGRAPTRRRVELAVPLRHDRPVELHDPPGPRLAERTAKVRAAHGLLQRTCEGRRVERVDQQAVDAVLDQLGRPPVPSGHHRRPRPPRLEDHDAEGLEAAGHDEELGVGHGRGDLLARQAPGEVDVRVDPEVASQADEALPSETVAADHEVELAPLGRHGGVRPQEQVEPFLLHDSAHGEDERTPGPALPARRALRRSGGRRRRQGHTVRHHHALARGEPEAGLGVRQGERGAAGHHACAPQRPPQAGSERRRRLEDVGVVHHGLALQRHHERDPDQPGHHRGVDAVRTEALDVQDVGSERARGPPQEADGPRRSGGEPGEGASVSSREREGEPSHRDAVEHLHLRRTDVVRRGRPHLDLVPGGDVGQGQVPGQLLHAAQRRRVRAGHQRDTGHRPAPTASGAGLTASGAGLTASGAGLTPVLQRSGTPQRSRSLPVPS